MHRRIDAVRLYLLTTAVGSFGSGLISTVYAIYYVRSAGLDALQLVLVGTALEASYFVFEVPTGAFADTYSRWLSMILGQLIIGAAWIGQALGPAFLAIAAFEVLRGLGEAFASGAPEAWLSNEVGDERLPVVLMRAGQVGRVAFLAGLVASVPLATFGVNVPLIAGGAFIISNAAVFAALMPERPFRRAERRRTWGDLAITARDAMRVVRGRPLLITIFLVELFFGAASEGYDRLWEAHLLRDFAFPALFGMDTVAWFAAIKVVGMLVAVAAIELARRRLDATRHVLVTRFLFAAQTLRIGTRIAFAFAPSFPAALASLWGGSLAAAANPLNRAWLTRNIDPAVRATVLSMNSLCNAGGQIAGGPAVGAIGNLSSLRAALATSAALLLPSLFLYARAESQRPREVEVIAR